jgi:hypothetical protein
MEKRRRQPALKAAEAAKAKAEVAECLRTVCFGVGTILSATVMSMYVASYII